MIKKVFGFPLRQNAGFVESMFKLVGLDWVVLSTQLNVMKDALNAE